MLCLKETEIGEQARLKLIPPPSTFYIFHWLARSKLEAIAHVLRNEGSRVRIRCYKSHLTIRAACPAAPGNRNPRNERIIPPRIVERNPLVIIPTAAFNEHFDRAAPRTARHSSRNEPVAGCSRFRARLLNRRRGIVAAPRTALRREKGDRKYSRAVTCPLRRLLLTGRIGHPPRTSYPGSRSAAREQRYARERYESVLIPSDGIKRHLG